MIPVKCSWTMCKWCKEVNDVAEGMCHHPNKEEGVSDGEIKLLQNTMVGCKLYCGKTYQ